jgi:hypothetical protein
MTLQEIFSIAVEWEPRVLTLENEKKANASCRHSLTVSQQPRKVLDGEGMETGLWRLADKTEPLKPKQTTKGASPRPRAPKPEATSGKGDQKSKRGKQRAGSGLESKPPSSVTDNSAKQDTESPNTSASPETKIEKSFSRESSQLPPRQDKRKAPENNVGDLPSSKKIKIKLISPGQVSAVQRNQGNILNCLKEPLIAPDSE